MFYHSFWQWLFVFIVAVSFQCYWLSIWCCTERWYRDIFTRHLSLSNYFSLWKRNLGTQSSHIQKFNACVLSLLFHGNSSLINGLLSHDIDHMRRPVWNNNILLHWKHWIEHTGIRTGQSLSMTFSDEVILFSLYLIVQSLELPPFWRMSRVYYRRNTVYCELVPFLGVFIFINCESLLSSFYANLSIQWNLFIEKELFQTIIKIFGQTTHSYAKEIPYLPEIHKTCRYVISQSVTVVGKLLH